MYLSLKKEVFIKIVVLNEIEIFRGAYLNGHVLRRMLFGRRNIYQIITETVLDVNMLHMHLTDLIPSKEEARTD